MNLLSKTDFLWYLDAPMHLWARVHGQLADQSPSAYSQHLIAQGQQVESLGLQYLKKNILPRYGQAQLLWQQPYEDGQYEIRVDALVHDQAADAYDLYEIKSVTTVKKDVILDIAFQVLLLEDLLPLREAYILHIHRGYQHQDPLDLGKFFVLERVSESVEEQRDAVRTARRDALASAQQPSPAPDMACTHPKTCPCPDLCHPDLPENSIYTLPFIGKKAAQLRKLGITAIADIPPGFDLNTKQRRHAQAARTGQPIIDQAAIQAALAELQYPLNFLDYETFAPAVPLFPGYRPYEHIVFQYALFVIEEPEAPPEHFYCLLTAPQDPAPAIIPHLLDNLTPNGSVIVWNQAFEAHRNQDLASHCPEYAPQLKQVNERLYDLMLIFRNGLYVHPDFKGSASLKAVLPVLCPDLGYEDLAIGQGEEAMLAWYGLVSGRIPVERHHDYIEALKAYCRMDTYGMIEILNKLRETIRS